MRFHAVNTAIM